MADSPTDARLEQLERRVRHDPASIAFAALAEEYRKAGRLDEAIATCRTGLKRHPAYLSARVTLGRALMESGALEEAEAELQRVVTAAPENLAAIRCLAELHDRRRDSRETEDRSQSATATAVPARDEVLPKALAVPAATESAPPPDDPVLAELEGFLASIVAARELRHAAHSS